jgi:hypothetical protein
MIVAYIAWPPDNGTYMWADPKTRGTQPPGVSCEVCGQRIDYDAVNPNYKPPRSYYDLCRTYDGSFLVSSLLYEYFQKQNLQEVLFSEVASSKRFFVLHCKNILKLVRPPTFQMKEFCESCHQFRSVYGIINEQLQDVVEPIHKGLFFSDLRVGYWPQMGHELIVGVDTWKGMVEQGFKGLKNGEPVEQDAFIRGSGTMNGRS